MERKHPTIGGSLVITGVSAWFIQYFIPKFAEDWLFGLVGDWIANMLPDQTPDWLIQYISYTPAAFLVVVGLMAITSIGSNICVKFSWPFFFRCDGIPTKQERQNCVSTKDERIPLNEFCKIAAQHGWDFGNDSIDPLDLSKGLDQAAIDGGIQFWGRKHNERVLIGLPAEYWKDYIIDPLSLVRISDRDGHSQGVVSDNKFIRSYKPLSDYATGHIDIHLSKTQALDWLKTADQYKGMTKEGDPIFDDSLQQDDHGWGRGFAKAQFDRTPTKENAIIFLTHLRTDGVVIRNSAGGLLLTANFDEWSAQVTAWMKTVINVINSINSADSEWFATLDIVPSSRVPIPNIRLGSDSERFRFMSIFRQHDYRLARLDDLLQKYGVGSSKKT